ncbi:hypothetical protein J6590_072642 [Homalodisca vitripennis]|nr:hypothetical protein J6590_072642 [Homalodisca vitripennis]
MECYKAKIGRIRMENTGTSIQTCHLVNVIVLDPSMKPGGQQSNGSINAPMAKSTPYR